ncbi:MAG TPA: hypothetical protein VNO30_45540 [Kofleriaceae bacterium]|nr:hypothetical protein [Kofleriaceae bacterium]
MAKQKPSSLDSFQSIDGAALAGVTGGRIIPRKGLDPAVVQGVTNLAKTIAEVGQVLSAQRQQGDAQLQQMMQKMMQARGAR